MKRAGRIPAALCLAAVVLLSSGCGGSGAPRADSSATSGAPAVQVDEGLLSVDVTVQRSILDPNGEQTDEQIIQGAKDKGMSAVVNPDRTVTYTMSRKQQRELLDGMRASVLESTATMVDDAQNSFTAIEVSDDMTLFTVKVDKARYSELEVLYALGFYMGGGLYQQFSGVKGDEVDVKVQFVDDATGEVLDSGSLRDWLDRQSQQPA